MSHKCKYTTTQHLRAHTCTSTITTSHARSQDHWLEKAREETTEQCMIVLIGNKCDFTQAPREVSEEEVLHFTEEQGLEYFEVSVMTGHNLLQSFHQVAAKLVARNANKVASEDPTLAAYDGTDDAVDLSQRTDAVSNGSTCWCGY
jgi:GTPase SAR1 family protein